MILEKIKDIMEEELGKDRNEVTLESDIIKDLGLDSLDIVTLIMAVEDEYGFTADDDEIVNLKTVGDVVTYIENATKYLFFIAFTLFIADRLRLSAIFGYLYKNIYTFLGKKHFSFVYIFRKLKKRYYGRRFYSRIFGGT